MPHPTEPVIVKHPETGAFVALDPAVDYDPSDVLVETYPWAFAPRNTDPAIVESVVIEKATAGPGQKRNRGTAKS
jgi:hypothetical protein